MQALDYDSDITNATLSIAASGYYDGSANIQANSGVIFTAIDEPVVVNLTAPAISEGSENGKILEVTLIEDIFAATINATNCPVSNLPSGVTAGTYTPVSNQVVRITLSGNRTIDYDSNIDNVKVTVKGNALTQHTYDVNSNLITFTANNDAELLSSTQSAITEGSENNATITVTLDGGTFAASLNKSYWTITDGPGGVSIGSVTRNSATEALITLTGNATVDYDANLSAILTVNQAEIDDYTGSDLNVQNGIVFTAILEPSYINIANYLGNPINEGAENGAFVLVTLINDDFISGLNINDWTINNLPVDVTIGSINRIDNNHVTIALNGNRGVDYDSNISNIEVVIDGSQFVTQTNTLSANTGVILTAVEMMPNRFI